MTRCSCLLLVAVSLGAAPLSVDRTNPRCFRYGGRTIKILTSAEHYGAVLNTGFDYEAYLREMRRTGQNGTRVFTFYRELESSVPGPGAANTLAPPHAAALLPWPRVAGHGKAADGLDKFDLDRWHQPYFDRLRNYVRLAVAGSVICEIVLFCNPYKPDKYRLFPSSAGNNVNGVGGGIEDPRDFMTLKDPTVVAFQERFVRKMAAELNEYDNVYFEICNEPNVHGNFTEAKEREVVAWIAHLARTLRRAEEGLSRRHLIAANAHYQVKLPDEPFLRHEDRGYAENPDIDIINYHYLSSKADARGMEFILTPQRRAGLIWRFLRQRDGFRKPVVFDETYSGIVNGDPEQYAVTRAEAWETLLSGAAGYSNLDWTFTPDDATGSGRAPIGDGRRLDGRRLRGWLQTFRRLLEGYDLEALAPAPGVFPREVPGYGYAASSAGQGRYILYLVDENLYLLKPCARRALRLRITLPPGVYSARLFHPRDGATTALAPVRSDGAATLDIPAFTEDAAVLLDRELRTRSPRRTR